MFAVVPLTVIVVLSEETEGCVRIFVSNLACFFARVSNKLNNLWLTYGCKDVNCADIFAKAAKQFVWRYLSCENI